MVKAAVVSIPREAEGCEASSIPDWDRKDSTMLRYIMLASAASLVIALSAPAKSQGAPQTVTLMKVDPQTLATGYRTSKVVGATVVNEANETVGTIAMI
jgi:hypothetical protein